MGLAEASRAPAPRIMSEDFILIDIQSQWKMKDCELVSILNERQVAQKRERKEGVRSKERTRREERSE